MTTGTPITDGLAASSPADASTAGGERADLLAVLASHRRFLRFTTRDLTDEQARQRTTVSELCLGGLIKHVASVERGWANFILEGPSALGGVSDMTEADWARRADGFRLLPEETLAGVLADYAEVAHRTDAAVASQTSQRRVSVSGGPRPVRRIRGRPATRCCTSSRRRRSTRGNADIIRKYTVFLHTICTSVFFPRLPINAQIMLEIIGDACYYVGNENTKRGNHGKWREHPVNRFKSCRGHHIK